MDDFFSDFLMIFNGFISAFANVTIFRVPLFVWVGISVILLAIISFLKGKKE